MTVQNSECRMPNAKCRMPKAMFATFFALFCVLHFAFCISEAQADEPAAKPVVVPFELLKTQHMAIKIKINGKGPYRVIFDTGAPTNLINNKVAKEAGITTKKPLFSIFPVSEKMKTLQIGDLKVENVGTMVFDHPTVSLIDKHFGPIEGLIGFPFFARFKMTVDYQKKELTFVPNNFEPPDAMKILEEGAGPGGTMGLQGRQGSEGRRAGRQCAGGAGPQSSRQGRSDGRRSLAGPGRPLDRFGRRLLRGGGLRPRRHRSPCPHQPQWQGNGIDSEGTSGIVKWSDLSWLDPGRSPIDGHNERKLSSCHPALAAGRSAWPR
jgi:hypothetical protein